MAKQFRAFTAASSGQRCTCAPAPKAASAPKPAAQPAPPPPDLAEAIKKAPFDRGGKRS